MILNIYAVYIMELQKNINSNLYKFRIFNRVYGLYISKMIEGLKWQYTVNYDEYGAASMLEVYSENEPPQYAIFPDLRLVNDNLFVLNTYWSYDEWVPSSIIEKVIDEVEYIPSKLLKEYQDLKDKLTWDIEKKIETHDSDELYFATIPSYMEEMYMRGYFCEDNQEYEESLEKY